MTDTHTSTANAVVRRLDGGAIVVDYGTTWYRKNPDGSIIRKDASNGGVRSRPAYPNEIGKIIKLIEEAGL